MIKHIIFLLFLISTKTFSNEINILNITHSFSPTIRHIMLNTDKLGDFEFIRIISFDENNYEEEELRVHYKDFISGDMGFSPFIKKFIKITPQNFNKKTGGTLIIKYAINFIRNKRATIILNLNRVNNTWQMSHKAAGNFTKSHLIINGRIIPLGVKKIKYIKKK